MSLDDPTVAADRTIDVERRIAAPPETVFLYFTDPKRYRRWQGVDAELEPRAGGRFRVVMNGRSGQVVSGAFLEVDPPNKLRFTWGWEPADGLDAGQSAVAPGSTIVEVTLVPDGDGTILRLRHTGLSTETSRRLHAWGWDFTLGRLQVAAADGDAGPNPFADF
jgi:uncharacterized protein YndB with AHSA1/START domain